jgi:hypothetical protein
MEWGGDVVPANGATLCCLANEATGNAGATPLGSMAADCITAECVKDGTLTTFCCWGWSVLLQH